MLVYLARLKLQLLQLAFVHLIEGVLVQKIAVRVCLPCTG